MLFEIDWSVNSDGVPISTVAKMTGASQEWIKQTYRRGDLGPAPDVGFQVTKVPLYHVAALFVLLAAKEKGVAISQVQEALPTLAGSAFIQLQLTEIAAGRCCQRQATPSLNIQLWSKLRSADGRQMLETKLPGGSIATRRYAFFGPAEIVYGDSPEEIEGLPEPLVVIDAWSIAPKMKQFLRGEIFATRIA